MKYIINFTIHLPYYLASVAKSLKSLKVFINLEIVGNFD